MLILSDSSRSSLFSICKNMNAPTERLITICALLTIFHQVILSFYTFWEWLHFFFRFQHPRSDDVHIVKVIENLTQMMVSLGVKKSVEKKILENLEISFFSKISFHIDNEWKIFESKDIVRLHRIDFFTLHKKIS